MRTNRAILKGLLILTGWCCALPACARDLLVLANNEAVANVAAEAIIKKHGEYGLGREDFELVMMTYQYVPNKVMADELIEAVLEVKKPIKEELERFGDVVKVAMTKRRFVVIMGTRGYVKQISEKKVKSYRVGETE